MNVDVPTKKDFQIRICIMPTVVCLIRINEFSNIPFYLIITMLSMQILIRVDVYNGLVTPLTYLKENPN